MHKVKIVTTDTSLLRWPTLPDKFSEIYQELHTIANSNFKIEIDTRLGLVPHVENERITHKWFDWLENQYPDCDFVAFHMSDKQRRKWGIQPTLRGSFLIDNDRYSEFYFWADEYTLRQGHNQFVQTFLHEFRHALMRGMGLQDDTHDQHKDGQIKGSFALLNMKHYSPVKRNLEKQASLLQKVVQLFKQLLYGTKNL